MVVLRVWCDRVARALSCGFSLVIRHNNGHKCHKYPWEKLLFTNGRIACTAASTSSYPAMVLDTSTCGWAHRNGIGNTGIQLKQDYCFYSWFGVWFVFCLVGPFYRLDIFPQCCVMLTNLQFLIKFRLQMKIYSN